MSRFNEAASAGRMIDEGLRDLTEEEHLDAKAESEELRRRRHVVRGYYPGNPTKRMSLSLHHNLLEEMEATKDEWKVFQQRNDLARGFDPVTGERLSREQHAEAVRQLDLTPEDLRGINYWVAVENDIRQECIAEDVDTAWKAHTVQ